jgi:hypothetical protein
VLLQTTAAGAGKGPGAIRSRIEGQEDTVRQEGGGACERDHTPDVNFVTADHHSQLALNLELTAADNLPSENGLQPVRAAAASDQSSEPGALLGGD